MSTEQDSSAVDLSDRQYYFNRELSWLEFNDRVLHEALDDRTPLLERLKFAAIFSSNLDEFFMVRVAILKQQVAAGISQLTPDGRTPQQQLEQIAQRLRPSVTKQHQHFQQVLRSQLKAQSVHILGYADLNEQQQRHLQDYFDRRIFPVLTPLAVDPAHPFPQMSNLSLNLAVMVKDPVTGATNFARVKVPGNFPRFLPLPPELYPVQTGEAMSSDRALPYALGGALPVVWAGVPLEQVVAHNLERLFPGMTVEQYSLFRITRDAYVELDDDDADDLLLAIQQEIRKVRLGGLVIRLEVEATMPRSMRERLVAEMELADSDVYDIEGLLNLRDLMSLLSLPLPELKDAPDTPSVPPRLRSAVGDIFSIIRQQDLLVHHPYESFAASVERFITEAAHDPQVLAIKMTLYRTSGDSPIAQALIAAAGNNKQVAVLVELKARFDEENNIGWAQQLEQSGVHVVYGLVGLKTHTKIVLVIRQEGEDLRRYVHIGTGNYNSKTARLYTDLGLLSGREELGADLTDLFNHLTGYSRQQDYRKLLVAPVNMRDRFTTLLHREIDRQTQNGTGRIIAKMNSLVDPQMIQTLYEASQAGIQIDLIVRGICCLRPGVAGVSDNIRVISIVGRYLEHSRIFYFYNQGAEEVFIGSADWMPRNLDRRIEAITPVEDPHLIQELKDILNILLSDNRQAWELQADGAYVQRRPNGEATRSAQQILSDRASRPSVSE